jgi:hypothetical protein
MLTLKPLSNDSIPSALVKAKHYRLLNEPWQAESICRDILNVDSQNQTAILYLILAISDQFALGEISAEREAKELCEQLTGPYDQKYFRGIIEERAGKAALKRTTPRAKYIAYEYYRKAMMYYEEAEAIRPEKNEDAVLRWNACVRRIQEYKLQPAPEEDRVQPFLE